MTGARTGQIPPVKFYVVPHHAVEELREAAKLRLVGKRRVEATLAKVPRAPAKYEEDAGYLASLLAYLEDADVLVECDFDLGEGLSSNHGARFSLYEGDAATPSGNRLERVTRDDLQMYWKGETQSNDERAGLAMWTACEALRKNLRAARGALLLVQW